jgi:cell division septum initiation protein DivIVA
MKREELLEKGYTEEQVSELLDAWHKANANLSKENEKLKTDLGQANETISGLNQKVSGLTKVEEEYNAIKQSQLTDEEKRKLALEEAEKKQREANKIYNTAKAREIFSEIGGISDEVLSSIITDDEKTTVANATNLLNLIKTRDEAIEKTTTEKLTSLDLKPNPSNTSPQDNVMTWEKFDSLSSDEQIKFAEEHPDDFAKM